MYGIACYGDEDCMNAAKACNSGDSSCYSSAICAYGDDYDCDSYISCDLDTSCVAGILCGADDTADDTTDDSSTCTDDVSNWDSTGTSAPTSDSGRKFARKALRASTSTADSWGFSSSVVLFGDSTEAVYCDHYHLYDFTYSNVTPADSTDDVTDMDVWGYTMVGFPNMCTYTDWIAISYPLIEGVTYATTGDMFAMTCGYYTEYNWDGYGDVYFEIDSDNAVIRALSTFALIAIGTLVL